MMVEVGFQAVQSPPLDAPAALGGRPGSRRSRRRGPRPTGRRGSRRSSAARPGSLRRTTPSPRPRHAPGRGRCRASLERAASRYRPDPRSTVRCWPSRRTPARLSIPKRLAITGHRVAKLSADSIRATACRAVGRGSSCKAHWSGVAGSPAGRLAKTAKRISFQPSVVLTHVPSVVNSIWPCAWRNGRFAAGSFARHRSTCEARARHVLRIVLSQARRPQNSSRCLRRGVERPTRPGQAHQTLRPFGRRPLDPQPLVERMPPLAARGADEVNPPQPHDAAGRQDRTRPSAAVASPPAAPAHAARRSFFSISSPCALSTASRLRRVSSRPAAPPLARQSTAPDRPAPRRPFA